MLEIVLPIAVLIILLLFVDQIRRLIANAVLNRTIRKALETDPGSVPLLVERLEPRRRFPDGGAGLMMLLLGVTVGVAGLFETEDRTTAFQIAAVAIVLGLGALGYAWFVERTSPRP